MSRNIASDEKWIFEVRNGVILIFGERAELADGWWFAADSEEFGPFATDEDAIDAAHDASDAFAEVTIVLSPEPPLPVKDAPFRRPSTTCRPS